MRPIFGTVAAIDRSRRELIDSVEIEVDEPRARALLGRGPDFEDPRMVSWGHLTRDEALRLVTGVEDELGQAELLPELERLLSRAGGHFVTLYYAHGFYG